MNLKTTNFHCIYIDSIDSTNSYIKKLLREEEPEEYTVILADYQQAGRGQRENYWHGKKGQNLTLSILFRPNISTVDHFYLAEIVSLAITDTLNDYGIPTKIKWPNDIYAGDKKIAGILIENSLESDNISNAIVGIGLNVLEIDFPEYLPNPTSMSLMLKNKPSREEVADILLEKILDSYSLLINRQLETLHQKYIKKLYRLSEESEYKTDEGIVKATLIGVETSGEIILQMQNKELKKYLFGEVQMII